MSQRPSYAVLFKTHLWNEFIERQYRRLCGCIKQGRVFIVVDETNGRVCIPYDDVVRVTSDMASQQGLLAYPEQKVFWHNGDYQIYLFCNLFPEFEYIFLAEYDCVFNISIDTIIEKMAEDGLAFVGERSPDDPKTWCWTPSVRPYYPESSEIVGRLVCCAGFSRAFVNQMLAARRDHTQLALSNAAAAKAPDWPHVEAFVGAEIARLGLAEKPLSAFGDISHYAVLPPYLEAELPALAHSIAVHPVREPQVLLSYLTQSGGSPEQMFVDGSRLRARMDKCDPREFVSAFLPLFVATANWSAVARLRDYSILRLGESGLALFNIAQGKPATQSSTSPWSRSQNTSDDAAGAVNGQVSGEMGFHTDLEPSPWWCVDLQLTCPVREIRIFNRLHYAERARGLAISYSKDLVNWTSLSRPDPDRVFGGADGSPLKFTFETCVPFRFLRLHLEQNAILHLDEVEIYV